MIQVVTEKPPVPAWPAVVGVTNCVLRTAVLLYRRRIHLPRHNVGQRLRFANGTIGAVYRETVVDRGPTRRPAVLVVGFQLRLLRGRGHALFRLESILNTPLFVGFPGFVSKLWLAHDGHGVYRGIYEWDDPALAENYARTLWRILAIGCVPGSIHYRVVPGLHRDEFLRDPAVLAEDGPGQWWLLSEPAPAFA